MKILAKIKRNRYFILFILLFAYVQSIYSRISVRQAIDIYTFTPEAAFASLFDAGILCLVISFFIRKKQNSNLHLDTKEMIKIFSISIISYILISQAMGFIIALLFDTVDRNFNRKTLTLSFFSDLLNGFVYGSFFIAYYYYHANRKNQKRLVEYHQAIAESKINQLKTQLNPHFLFNNLNILDQLIEEDQNKASNFLNEFAEIYRYVLQSSDKKLVTIEEELYFAKQYFSLIEHKYRTAYQLQINTQTTQGFIIPLTLQLLIENAIKHNLGTAETPVFIHILLHDRIQISNNKKAKKHHNLVSGRALKNLKQQYDLLSNETITINEDDDKFVVSIPIIRNKK